MTVLDQGKNALFLFKGEETQVQEVEIIERQIGAENRVSLRGVIRRLLENGRNRKQLEITNRRLNILFVLESQKWSIELYIRL